MSVEFNERKPLNYDTYNGTNQSGGLTNLIIKIGLAKDQKGANKAMIALSIIFLILAIYFFSRTL